MINSLPLSVTNPYQVAQFTILLDYVVLYTILLNFSVQYTILLNSSVQYIIPLHCAATRDS